MDNKQSIENRVKTAFIPAGASGSKLIQGKPKAFLDIAGRKTILRCLDAINQTSIETVVTWHENSEELRKIIEQHRSDFCNIKNISVLKAQKNLADNLLLGTTERLLKYSSLPKYTGEWNDFNAISKYKLENPLANEEPVLILLVDAILLSENCLDKYIDQFNRFPDTDLLIGYTQKDIIEKIGKIAGKEISSIDSTINNYDYTKDYIGRHNNIFIIKPMKLIEKNLIDFARHAYKNRYQSRLLPRIMMYFHGFMAIVNYKFKNKGEDKIPFMENIVQKIKYPLDIIETARFYNKFNKAKSKKLHKNIVEKARQSVIMEQAEEIIEKIIGIKARIYKKGGIAVMDIDDEPSYNIINDNYSKIIEYGNSLNRRKL